MLRMVPSTCLAKTPQRGRGAQSLKFRPPAVQHLQSEFRDHFEGVRLPPSRRQRRLGNFAGRGRHFCRGIPVITTAESLSNPELSTEAPRKRNCRILFIGAISCGASTHARCWQKVIKIGRGKRFHHEVAKHHVFHGATVVHLNLQSRILDVSKGAVGDGDVFEVATRKQSDPNARPLAGEVAVANHNVAARPVGTRGLKTNRVVVVSKVLLETRTFVQPSKSSPSPL